MGSLWLRGTVHLLLCADSFRLDCWDCITCSPNSQGTLAAKRRQESEKSRPREPLPSAGCFGSTALPGRRAGLQGNTLSAFFSLDSGSAPTPDYLCPCFLTDINSPLASPPMLAGFPKAKITDYGLGPPVGCSLMVCVPTGSSLSTLKSAWSLSDLHSPHPPPFTPGELEPVVEPGQK